MGRAHALFQVRGTLPRRTRLLLGAASLLLIVVVWSAVTYTGAVKPLYLPTPTALVAAAGKLLTPERGEGFFQAPLVAGTLISLTRVLKALSLTALIGFPVGLLMGSFPLFDGLLGPPVSALKAVPATAFIGLVILVYGIGEEAKVVFLVLGAVFFMVLMVQTAVLGVRDTYVRTAIDVGASGWQMIVFVLLPGALPAMWESLIICNGIMWTYIVLAELIAGNSGLGFMITYAAKTYHTGEMYVSLLTIALVAFGTDALLRWLQRLWFPWKDR